MPEGHTLFALARDLHEAFAGSRVEVSSPQGKFTEGAAELTGRVCLAMEIDPRYCDVTIERWQRLTGATAVLAGEESSFEDLVSLPRCL